MWLPPFFFCSTTNWQKIRAASLEQMKFRLAWTGMTERENYFEGSGKASEWNDTSSVKHGEVNVMTRAAAGAVSLMSLVSPDYMIAYGRRTTLFPVQRAPHCVILCQMEL